ncbi:hypothetical protein ACIBSW_33610 [Actinoplanes sp. NPDC049668]|uniref:hypothetical protein n=1 Tax=unclassified Actinoplanes TaxID=2626549 RepID=UPI0033A0DD8A
MSDYSPPRVLDASAIVELFHGHPMLMQLLDRAAAGQVAIGVPTAAIAEAQAVLGVNAAMWDHILRLRGLVELPLGAHGALEVGRLARPRIINPVAYRPLTSPLQVAHVLHEARGLAGIVVTGIPEAYGGHPDITVHSLTPPPGPGAA